MSGMTRASTAASPQRTSRASAPDLAEVARQAVVSFLHDASAATAEREAAGTLASTADDGSAVAFDPTSWTAATTASTAGAQSETVRAAAAGLATLERIEAAAAKVEEDIAVALQTQAELQAGAGRAAEAAVRAAQEAWMSADSAAESDRKARISLHLVVRYVTILMALLFIAIIVLIVTATSVH